MKSRFILIALALLTSVLRLSAAPAGPTIFVCGDSTAKNTAAGAQGWGTAIEKYFDPALATVSNVAHAGTSSLTYYNGDWPNVLPKIKAGDYVLLVFGINDGGLHTPPGLGDATTQVTVKTGQTPVTAHTYGWYMEKMTNDAQAKGAHVYLLTLTVRNIWTNPNATFKDATPTGALSANYNPAQDKIVRGDKFAGWTQDVGRALHVPVLDLNNLEGDRYEQLGREKVMVNYLDHNHTNPAGADRIASYIVSGLKAFQASPFLALLSTQGRAVETAAASYVAENLPATTTSTPSAAPAKPVTLAATAATATPAAPFPVLTPADIPKATQSGTVPVAGGKYMPPVAADLKLPTLWLIGDSTVRNGTPGDGTNMNQWGWGAPLVAYFDQTKINVVNRALGGTSSRTFYKTNWPAMIDLIQKGDYVVLQFGANDNGGAAGKGGLNGIGDNTEMNGKEVVHSFGWYLKQYVAETRAKGATPIICSLTPRKGWTADGHFTRANTTHAAWAGQIAQATSTPFVDLYEQIARRYEQLGKAPVDLLYVPSPKEGLHTGWDGAVINAECVVAGLKALKDDPLAAFLSPRGQAVAAVDTTRPAAAPMPAVK